MHEALLANQGEGPQVRNHSPQKLAIQKKKKEDEHMTDLICPGLRLSLVTFTQDV